MNTLLSKPNQSAKPVRSQAAQLRLANSDQTTKVAAVTAATLVLSPATPQLYGQNFVKSISNHIIARSLTEPKIKTPSFLFTPLSVPIALLTAFADRAHAFLSRTPSRQFVRNIDIGCCIGAFFYPFGKPLPFLNSSRLLGHCHAN